VTNASLGGARLVDTRAAVLIGEFGGSVTVNDDRPIPDRNGARCGPMFRFVVHTEALNIVTAETVPDHHSEHGA
jgi:hypothetical protein